MKKGETTHLISINNLICTGPFLMEEKSISNDASILYFLGKMEKTTVLKSIVNNNLLKDNRNKRNLEIFEVQDERKIIYIPST